MKLKNILMASIAAVTLAGCANTPTIYSNLKEYPVYSGNDLGVTFTPNQSKFKAWSPGADSVRLAIYDQGSQSEAIKVLNMSYDKEGLWTQSIRENLNGKFYTFQVHQDGKWYNPTPGLWAKAVGVNGDRAAIIDLSKTNPEGWNEDQHIFVDQLNDAVIYEVHMRDFTISPTSGSTYAGKFLGLSESGTLSPEGLATGIDHLKELGITHVQILPSYDYASIDEADLDQNNYNWGYDPKNYNAPEGGYATNPFKPATRIHEMKQMIQQLHNAGIGVIMDVVYNHTYEGEHSPINLMSPHYFHRFNEDGSWGNGSGCGNETATEHPMVRETFAKSLQYWVNEYHVDGFRFDLMGIHDTEAVNYFRKKLDELNPKISMHGEGWNAGPCVLPDSVLALKDHAAQFQPVGVFSDVVRDAMRGSWTEGNAGGFITGNASYDSSIRYSVAAAMQHPQTSTDNIVHTSVFFAQQPYQTINYVSCHDNECLRDKIEAILPNASEEEVLAMDKLAQTIVFTSQGVPFIFAGSEVFRTKQGVENSYKSPDAINQIDWSNKSKYNDLFTYYKELISLRKSHPAFRMRTKEQVQKHLVFLENQEANVVAFQYIDHANGDTWKNITVIFNGNHASRTIQLPEGEWKIAAQNGTFTTGNTVSNQITVNASSAAILYQD